ncbi:3-dehydro-L-gulonate 2-dehydrogenase [Mucilaginibacter lappiensis]|uniref:3-dehydro-L-gulonate 2-dehydrogenase n=1 Tax=Mucilaginibacter lappiensis TaxID=354630 RepID=A0ABR6PPL0_9SPHI|nr:3-dehydro-L-gulonate 2-dehydrogenase [Mucilaginibacter lappiensis]MBB6111707.1 3-dehydro-L-gulonate 2-dehydrogenase [Mucilaginibacter lappiensis]SIR82840.1 3-dehydro-L-gulonate 2-dehydrogenase [Mucilaginibacter lappiensis]
MRVPFEKLKAEFKRILLNLDFTTEKAEKCATIFAENSRDGVYTHGLSRFPVFVQFVKGGWVKPDAEPVKEGGLGAIEQWDGNYGPGMLNAGICMNRAMELANENGIGCVAIKNTNHWMRGGTYGWQAAEAGYIGICFTNTIANLPPWGGLDPRLGNNPLVIAVPRKNGHVVLDMAISQYAVGKLKQYEASGEQLPLPGGYDNEGHLSTDAAAILKSERVLPIGFWKGSGLSLVLDLLATVLSGGNSTARISKEKTEAGISQVFICIKPKDDNHTAALIEEIIAYTKTSTPEHEGGSISYPGENTLKTRAKNLSEGVWVDEKIWNTVLGL